MRSSSRSGWTSIAWARNFPSSSSTRSPGRTRGKSAGSVHPTRPGSTSRPATSRSSARPGSSERVSTSRSPSTRVMGSSGSGSPTGQAPGSASDMWNRVSGTTKAFCSASARSASPWRSAMRRERRRPRASRKCSSAPGCRPRVQSAGNWSVGPGARRAGSGGDEPHRGGREQLSSHVPAELPGDDRRTGAERPGANLRPAEVHQDAAARARWPSPPRARALRCGSTPRVRRGRS